MREPREESPERQLFKTNNAQKLSKRLNNESSDQQTLKNITKLSIADKLEFETRNKMLNYRAI